MQCEVRSLDTLVNRLGERWVNSRLEVSSIQLTSESQASPGREIKDMITAGCQWVSNHRVIME